MSTYPENSLSKFRNQLMYPLSLKGEWEVAINEIFYPLGFVPNTHTVSFSIVCVDGEKTKFITKYYSFDFIEGCKIQSLLEQFNEKMLAVFDDEVRKKNYYEYFPPRFACTEETNNKVDLNPGYISKVFGTKNSYVKKFCVYPDFRSNDLFDVLGFDPTLYRASMLKCNPDYNEVVRASNPPNNSLKTTLLFIYTDIIREHPVGDTTAPLLRVAPLSKGSFESVGHITFTNGYYYKLRSNYIENIDILLCDELGKQIKFENGRVFISLHFKRCK